jgi:hypothetical protein
MRAGSRTGLAAAAVPPDVAAGSMRYRVRAVYVIRPIKVSTRQVK